MLAFLLLVPANFLRLKDVLSQYYLQEEALNNQERIDLEKSPLKELQRLEQALDRQELEHPMI